MSQPDNHSLLHRCFTIELQGAFSRLSGDCNPMHDDPVSARRTLAGGQVVHGIHQALAATEAALAHSLRQGSPARAIIGLTAVFLKPVLVGETVAFQLGEVTSETRQITGSVQGDDVCRITIRWGDSPVSPVTGLPPLHPGPVIELTFNELAGRSGSIDLGLDHDLACIMFPLATAAMGPHGIAGVLALSRLVGMHCPGLHSLFGQCTVSFQDTSGDNLLHYQVQQMDDRFGKVVMQVTGPSLQGQVTAFFRPPPALQPGMGEVARLVKPGIFAQSTALIVGGSRGLGEITARLIAAGGGLPIITYHRGVSDAERIADDIRSAGKRCEVLQIDVRSLETFLQKSALSKWKPLSLYYFATPKIFGRRRGFFDYDALREFQEIYVTAFGRIVDSIAAICPAKLRVFYPSSVAVDEILREMIEYSMAKRAGEEMCAFYNRHAKRAEIVVERLPRIQTDQTNTLMPIPAESALDAMLPVVLRMEMPIQDK